MKYYNRILVVFIILFFAISCKARNVEIEYKKDTFNNEQIISEIPESKKIYNSDKKIENIKEIIEDKYSEGESENDLSWIDSIWNKPSTKEEDKEAMHIFEPNAIITGDQKIIPIIIYERPDIGSGKKGTLEINESFQILQTGGLVSFIRSDQTKKGYWYKIVSKDFGLGSIFIDEEVIINDKLKTFEK
ncbi:hypothetical protein FACS1894110_25940 [Spirochaetia bacterium]|nr:hypothetical protein FACS1894110_25940 [Spirochaetia bacterium]